MLAQSSAGIISGLFLDKSPEEIKFLALNLVHQAEVLVVLAAYRNEHFHLVAAASDSLKVDVREVIPLLQTELQLKGGGSQTLVELVSPEKEKAERAVGLAVEFLKRKKNLT